MAQSKGFRCEVSLTELTYRGDRDERLNVFTVAGEGDTFQEAINNCSAKMSALGYDPRLMVKEATDDRSF